MVLRAMETGLPSAPSRRRIEKQVKMRNMYHPKLAAAYQCKLRVKEEADPHQPEYFLCPLLEKMKEESVELEKCIKKEQHDYSNLTLTGEASRQCNDNLPHGLIPPIEMEDKCEVECAENVNTRRNTFLTKNITVKRNITASSVVMAGCR